MTNNEKSDSPSEGKPSDWRESLGLLMRQLVDDELSLDQQRELVAILESSDEAKHYYLNYLQMHSELGHQWGGDELPLRIDQDDAKGPEPLSRAPEKQDIRNTFRALGWLFLGMAASGLFFAFFLVPDVHEQSKPSGEAVANGVAIELDPKREALAMADDGLTELDTLPKQAISGWNDVAVIVRNEGVEDASLQIGKRLTAGVVRFESGTLQLQFMSGASMVLVGPAELQIESARVATLLAGTVKTRVNERAKGFILNTADAAVVDIGTEFGLRFDASGQPEVEVTEGEVEFSLLGADGNTLSSRRVLQSEVVAIDREPLGEARLSEKSKRAAEGSPGNVSPQIELPSVSPPGTSDEYSRSVRDDRPLVYWRFDSESDGMVPNEMGSQWAAKITHADETAPTLKVDRGRLQLERSPSSRYVTSIDPIHGLDESPFTIEFWMNPDDLEHSHCVGIAPFLTADPQAFLGVVEVVTDTFLIHQPGSLRVLYRNPPDRHQQYGTNVFSPGMVTPGQWHHVTMVNTDHSVGLYLDGQMVRILDSEVGAGPKSQEGFRVILGQLSMPYNQRQFSGSIDEFALYDRALDPSEILQHYRAATAAQ